MGAWRDGVVEAGRHGTDRKHGTNAAASTKRCRGAGKCKLNAWTHRLAGTPPGCGRVGVVNRWCSLVPRSTTGYMLLSLRDIGGQVI